MSGYGFRAQGSRRMDFAPSTLYVLRTLPPAQPRNDVLCRTFIPSYTAPMRFSFRLLSESYIAILAAAILFGLLVPATRALVPYNTLLLQAIFLISSLKLNGAEIIKHGKDWKLLLASNAIMIILLPFAVRIIAPSIVPDLAFPLFLLAAMPVGMTSPLLVEVIGGRQALALVLTVTSSLFAPLSIPIVTKIAYGQTISVDAFAMFKSLLLVILLPFAVAMILKRVMPNAVRTINAKSKPFSLVLLGLVIASAIAAHASEILGSLASGGALLRMLFILFVFFVLLHLIGYYGLWWKTREDRLTISVCLTYMNFTLAIYLSSKYFSDPVTVLALVLAILPWAMLLPVWKRVCRMRLLP